MRLSVIAVFAAAALAACDMSHQAPAPPKAPPPVAEAPAPPASAETPMTAADLVDCAGALAAAGNVEITAGGPKTDTPASNAVWTVLALLDKEEAYKTDAAKARADVTAARDAWKLKPAPELAARSAACTTRFPG